jgi:hypothetical protein
MVQRLQKQLREAAVRSELADIVEALNREHGPVLREVKARLQELIDGLNPGEVAPAAGAVAGYLYVTIGGTEYAIELLERA